MTLPIPTETGIWFVYDGPDGTVKVELCDDGSFYGTADQFDFSADTTDKLLKKLASWTFVGTERYEQ